MAQSAGRSENRHGFIFRRLGSYNFGKITSMATTTRGNLLVCDNKEKTLVLLNPHGDYLCNIKLDYSPYDVDVSHSNKCIVTAPSDRRFLHLDPDQLLILEVEISQVPREANDLITSTFNLASVSVTKTNSFFMYTKGGEAYLSCRWPPTQGYGGIPFSASKIKALEYTLDVAPPVLEYRQIQLNQRHEISRMVSNIYGVTCKENKILKSNLQQNNCSKIYQEEDREISIPSIDGITDICIDDNHHIYLTGLFSHTVHRLTEDGSILDIPLKQTNTQGLKSPTSITFNQSYTKLYVATEWGTKVMVFDVV